MSKKLRFIAVFMMILFVTNSIILYAAPKPAETINMPPTIDLSAKPKKKPVDIVILTDYTGTKLVALQNQINLLKAKFENVNVDPVFHVINDMKKIGTQNDAIYMFRRYASFGFTGDRESYNGMGGGSYKENCKSIDSVVWEEKEELLSKYASLPKRNPTNVSYTTGTLKTETYDDNGKGWYKYYTNVRVYASNDIKSYIDIGKVYLQYLTVNRNDMVIGSEYYNVHDYYAAVDKNWTKEEKVRDVTYDIMCLDFNKLNTVPLRTDSDRYMMFISDGEAKDYSQQSGSYFSFGDLTEQVSQYIQNNKFTTIGVVPDGIKDMWMLNDKVTEIEPFIEYTNFRLMDGTWKKIGGNIYNSLPDGTIAYPENATNVDNIKNVKKVIGDFVLFKNGSLKKYDRESDAFTDIPNLPTGVTFNNVVDIYNYGSYNHSIYIELNTGEVYIYYVWDDFNPVKKLPFMSGYKKAVRIDWNNYLLDKAGGLYILELESEAVYDSNYKYIGSKCTVKYKTIYRKINYDRSGNKIKKNLTSRFKDIDNRFILFNDGDLVDTIITYEWEGIDYNTQVYYVVDWDNNYNYPNSKVIDTGVKEIVVKAVNGRNDIVFYKKDGDTTYKYAGWYPYYYNCHENDDGDWVCRTKYYYKQPTKSNIKSFIELPLINETLTIDTNNNLYILTGFNVETNNITPTLYKIGKFDLDAVYALPSSSYNTYKILIKTKSGEAHIFTYYRTQGSSTYYYTFTGSGRGLAKVPNNLRYVKSSPNGSIVYLAYEDGTVRGYGQSETGQLGIKRSSVLENRDPFVNDFILADKTKKYITLNTLFRDSLDNKFYPTGQYATALNDIYNKYKNTSSTGSMYILLGEEIEYMPSTYKDRENDPEYSRKWTISHDPNYFDNSMGLSAYHNPTGVNTNPPTKFDKVGKYVINLKARDNPKNDNLFDNYRLWSTGDQNLTLYVHRKPIPLMNISVTQNPDETWRIIAADGGSYDLDHTSRADKGIVEWQWAWRDQWEDSWHYERMNRLNATGDRAYIIALRVQDIEGVWSDWIYQTIDNRQPPVAKFDIVKNPITTVELAQIKDTSYAIMSNPTNWHWIVKKINDNGSIGATLQEVKATSSNTGAGGYDTSLDLTGTNPGVGRYRIYLRVKADNGLWSDGGTDAAPNINNMFYRDLTVNQALSIDDISITGRWNHFRGWTDKFGVWKDVMKDTTYIDEKGVNRYPYRFLSYEMIDIKIKLEGYADEVTIDFPVNSSSGYSLGSMYYKDRLGYEYSYQEDLGYTVNFPYKGPYKTPLNPAQKDPIIEWRYILPLVHSSATWENIRQYQPYEIKITAKKGSYEVTQTKKIDITGNVDDLIFIQPVAR